jgi:hypothetical protein
VLYFPERLCILSLNVLRISTVTEKGDFTNFYVAQSTRGSMKSRIVDEDLKKRLGRVIGILRRNLGMEQLDLALAVGFGHASSISQIESGKRSL